MDRNSTSALHLLLRFTLVFLCFVLTFTFCFVFTLMLLDLDLLLDLEGERGELGREVSPASALLNVRLGATAFFSAFFVFFGVICRTIISNAGSFLSELDSELRDREVCRCSARSMAMFSMRFSLPISSSFFFPFPLSLFSLPDLDRARFTSFTCFLPFDFGLDRTVLADLAADVAPDFPRDRARPFSAPPFFFVFSSVYDEVILGV